MAIEGEEGRKLVVIRGDSMLVHKVCTRHEAAYCRRRAKKIQRGRRKCNDNGCQEACGSRTPRIGNVEAESREDYLEKEMKGGWERTRRVRPEG